MSTSATNRATSSSGFASAAESPPTTIKHHPFDVVGWDGYLFPFIFNIGDFEPITGRVHQPPPVHQTFAGRNYVVCSFVPRKFDYHPLAIPAPYNHSNINSDEVIYYVAGNFMSRRGVEISSFTLHPAGIPHGPHPGTVEASIGKEATEELAVMVDTFHPLNLTREAAGSRTSPTRTRGCHPTTLDRGARAVRTWPGGIPRLSPAPSEEQSAQRVEPPQAWKPREVKVGRRQLRPMLDCECAEVASISSAPILAFSGKLAEDRPMRAVG